MTTNTKIAWSVVAILILMICIYAFSSSQKIPMTGIGSQSVSSFLLQGTVTGISTDKSEITVVANGVEKIVMIDPATKIEQVLSQKNAAGTIEKQITTEVNVSDVLKGSQVTINYQSEKASVLSGVNTVVFSVDGSVNAFLKTPQPIANTYMEAQVVGMDFSRTHLQYKPYLFDTVGTTTMTMTIPSNISVYRVNDSLRLSIIHARVPASLADLYPGTSIFFVIAGPAQKNGIIVPQSIIISGT